MWLGLVPKARWLTTAKWRLQAAASVAPVANLQAEKHAQPIIWALYRWAKCSHHNIARTELRATASQRRERSLPSSPDDSPVLQPACTRPSKRARRDCVFTFVLRFPQLPRFGLPDMSPGVRQP